LGPFSIFEYVLCVGVEWLGGGFRVLLLIFKRGWGWGWVGVLGMRSGLGSLGCLVGAKRGLGMGLPKTAVKVWLRSFLVAERDGLGVGFRYEVQGFLIELRRARIISLLA
jgi:hypothetical protein